MTQNQHPEDVKAAVRKTGISLAELARRNGMKESTGPRALHEPCPRMNQAIAEHLDTSVHTLWPEWFDSKGERILRFKRKATTGNRGGHGQKSAAA